MAKATVRKPLTKTEIYNTLATETGLTKKQISDVFESLSGVIDKQLNTGKKTEDKAFTIPGLCKIVTKYKKATPERKGIDPFTKEERVFRAKPASQQVKIRPLKALKDMVNG